MLKYDLSGKRFNRLLVIEKDIIRDSSGCIRWKCKCDCGNELSVSSSSLRSNHTKSCGCLLREYSSKRKFKDYTSIKFNRLLALRPTFELSKDRGMIWEFLCDCGQSVFHEIHSVKGNRIKSCGCLYKEIYGARRDVLRKDIIGSIFGNLILLSVETNGNGKFYNCKCNCGNIYKISKYLLRRAKITDCGCLSDNSEKEEICNRLNPESKIWKKDVLTRDNFTCHKCNKKRNLVAHHILNFSNNQLLRYNIDNGITFCKLCHDKFHKIFGQRNNSKIQINQFLQN